MVILTPQNKQGPSQKIKNMSMKHETVVYKLYLRKTVHFPLPEKK